jgi:hypothetical protein
MTAKMVPAKMTHFEDALRLNEFLIFGSIDAFLGRVVGASVFKTFQSCISSDRITLSAALQRKMIDCGSA